jgi:hypothetical protein
MNFISSLRQNLFCKTRNLSLQRRKSFKPCHFKIICIKFDTNFALTININFDTNFAQYRTLQIDENQFLITH